MAVTVTIRNVPVDVRNVLAARAAQEGRSLQEYLRRAAIEMAARPTVAEVVERARLRAEASQTSIGTGDILAARDADRR